MSLGVLSLPCTASAQAVGQPPQQGEPPAQRPVVPSEPQPEGADEVSFIVLPYPLYTPETSLALGLGSVVLLPADAETPQRRSLLEFNALLSIRKQALVGHRSQLLFGGGDWELLLDAVGRIHWPDRFYPIGNESGPDEFEPWTLRGFRLELAAALRRVVGPLFAGPLIAGAWSKIEPEEGGTLARGDVPGSQDHSVLGAGVMLRVDFRDRLRAPRRGGLYSATWAGFDEALGSDFGFTRFELDLRHYFNPWLEHVVSVRLFAGMETGTPPFTWLQRLGSVQRMRGFYATRFLDRHTLFGVVEYRLPLFWRFGAVAFVGTGEVMHRLGDFALDRLHIAGGGGVRFRITPDEPLNVSLDLAAGAGEFNAYVVIGEAF